MKKVILTTTFKRLRAASACKSRYKHLRTKLNGHGDTNPINLLTILKHNGLDDALWAMCATSENSDKVARLVAADFAEQVLPLFQRQHPNDNRPALAIQAARDFANGLITPEQRAAASDAAWAAARAAASDAARAAARAAAWAAASDAAWAAASDAARAAAWAAASDAAWAAASDAAWAAVRAAAMDAARAKQEQIFRSYLKDSL